MDTDTALRLDFGLATVVVDHAGLPDDTVLRRVAAFFGTHATVTALPAAESVAADVVLRCSAWEDTPGTWIDAARTPVTMRLSSAAAFNLSGLTGPLDGHHITVCPGTTTAFRFRDGDPQAEVRIGPDSFIQVVEFIRDVVLKTAERNGAVQLHAACAARDGVAVAVVGAKGAGKSTMLLDLVARHGFDLVSGDKVLLQVLDGAIVARGWPDFPHLGVGTILGHPALAAELTARGHVLDPAEPQRKLLLEPEVLEKAFGLAYEPGPVRLGALVLPRVADAHGDGLTPLGDRDGAVAQAMPHVERTADNRWMQWHSFRTSAPAEVSARQEAELAEHLRRVDCWRSAGRAPYAGAGRLVGR